MEQNSLQQPLNKLNIFSLKGVQMQTFHITWLTFFFCFFAWFGIAPLMPLVSEQLHLTKAQKGNVTASRGNEYAWKGMIRRSNHCKFLKE